MVICGWLVYIMSLKTPAVCAEKMGLFLLQNRSNAKAENFAFQRVCFVLDQQETVDVCLSAV